MDDRDCDSCVCEDGVISTSLTPARSHDRRVDEVAEQDAEILAVFGCLHQYDCEQVVARRDPERRAGSAAPEIFADAARRWREARLRPYAEAEAEAMTGPQQVVVLGDIRRQMVARHECDRAR